VLVSTAGQSKEFSLGIGCVCMKRKCRRKTDMKMLQLFFMIFHFQIFEPNIDFLVSGGKFLLSHFFDCGVARRVEWEDIILALSPIDNEALAKGESEELIFMLKTREA
jgi:hypothetical protein